MRHTLRAPDGHQPVWAVQQTLVDDAMVNDWVAEFEVDVEASRRRQQPAMWLTRIGPVG